MIMCYPYVKDMNKSLVSKRNAVTLLELCIVIAIGAVCVVPLLAMLGTAVRNTANNESIAKSIYLAQGRMEEVLASDFYNISLTEGIYWWPDGLTYEKVWVEAAYINPNATDLGSSQAVITSPGRSNYLKVTVIAQRWRLRPGVGVPIPITSEVRLVSLVTPHGY